MRNGNSRKKKQKIEDCDVRTANCDESIVVKINAIPKPDLARAEANTRKGLRKMLSVERRRRESLEAVQERAQVTAAAVIADVEREAQEELDEQAILEAEYEAMKAKQKKRREEIAIEKAAFKRLKCMYMNDLDAQVNLQATINHHKRNLEQIQRETATNVLELQSQLHTISKTQDKRRERMETQIKV